MTEAKTVAVSALSGQKITYRICYWIRSTHTREITDDFKMFGFRHWKDTRAQTRIRLCQLFHSVKQGKVIVLSIFYDKMVL